LVSICFVVYTRIALMSTKAVARMPASSLSLRDLRSWLQQADLLQHFVQFLAIRSAYGKHGQSVVLSDQTHHRQRRLDGDRIRFDEVGVHQGQQLVLQFARAHEVAFECGIDNRAHPSGRFIRYYGNDAIASESDYSQGHVIVAREDAKLTRLASDDVHNL